MSHNASSPVLTFIMVAMLSIPSLASAADEQRQAEVAMRGPDVMPFSLAATTHIFTKSSYGGTQRVVAKRSDDLAQVKLVRQHLHDIQRQFLAGDFSGPEHIHGATMPGLAELRSANPGQIAIAYRDVPGGAELSYLSADTTLIAALHAWFDAQLSDHGADAVAGHQHHHEGMNKP